MKTSKKNFLKYITAFLFVFALVLPTNMDALTSGSDDRSESRSNDDKKSGDKKSGDKKSGDKKSGDKNSHDNIPLDGGLGILVLGAAAFGIRKLRGKKEDK
jgi:hypothetical protein